ncbi:hypothetical protein KEJ44_08985 [Candidatus Bathyarchaeota archaeon]|nr:hypothetical protein [Candidatus Bathyarchaeota archaeon]
MMEQTLWRGKVSYSPVQDKYFTGEIFEGQLVDVTDISSVEAQVILDEVLGLARPQYRLRPVCREIRMDHLTMRVDIATSLTGQEKVPELVEAEISAQTYTTVDFNLWKNVVHVALSDEAVKKAAHDILRLHVQDAAKELARMENKQIAAELENATGVTGHDWGSSSNNPFDDVTGVISIIEGAGYEPDFMALHPYAWSKFITNDHVEGMVEAGIAQLGAAGGQFNLPGYPTIRVVVDNALTNTIAVIGDSKAPACVLGIGPTEAAQYRNEKAGYTAYIIRQWLQPKLVVSNAIRKLNGIAS